MEKFDVVKNINLINSKVRNCSTVIGKDTWDTEMVYLSIAKISEEI